jgi:hypothetical protein
MASDPRLLSLERFLFSLSLRSRLEKECFFKASSKFYAAVPSSFSFVFLSSLGKGQVLHLRTSAKDV